MSALSVLLLAFWTHGAATAGNSSSPEDELSLLQLPISHPAPKLAPLDPASQAVRLKAAMPLAWVHVPKCGSSIANFMTDLPGVCPDIPKERTISNRIGGRRQLPVFRDEFGVLLANGSCHGNIFRWGDHDGVGNAFNWEEHYKGHAMIMVRQPEQRLMSAYAYNQHSWPDSIPPAANPLEFAKQVQGCTVRQLTRERKVGPWNAEDSVCGGRQGGPASQDEVDLAVKRLYDAAFVGITDQWALSICLGHRMFGGRCRLSDFVDSRPSKHNGANSFNRVQVRTQPVPWNTKPLRGFQDHADGALYAAAQGIFKQELRKYGASLESCQPCFDEAGIELN